MGCCSADGAALSVPTCLGLLVRTIYDVAHIATMAAGSDVAPTAALKSCSLHVAAGSNQ